MPEREENPADSSETRDFEIPPMDDAPESKRSGSPGDAPAGPESPAPPEPPDESERRDWDLP